MIQPGTYRARAIAADITFGRSSNGNEQIAIPFTIVDERAAGQVITWIGTFANEKAIEIAINALRATGWSSDNITDLAGVGDVESDLVVEHEADKDGQMRARVKWVNRAGGGRFKFREELDKGSLTDLASRIKGYAIASRDGQKPASGGANGGGNGPQHRRVPAQGWDGTGRTPPPEDDLPF